MTEPTRALVRVRASNRCEYCLLPQEWCGISHHIEHIRAKQHNGSSDLSNLALACHRCNAKKGPNLSGVDPESGGSTPLFHPRIDKWADHFGFDGPRIFGLTAVGRTTVRLLGMNDARRLQIRAELIELGVMAAT